MVFIRGRPNSYMWEKEIIIILCHTPPNEWSLKPYPAYPYASPYLCASFLIYIHNVYFQILSNIDIDFKHILFNFTWVWDNHIEIVKWTLDPITDTAVLNASVCMWAGEVYIYYQFNYDMERLQNLNLACVIYLLKFE